MYKVSEVAKSEGISVAAVYKAIKRLDDGFITEIDGVIHITEEGYETLKGKFSKNKAQTNSSGTFDLAQSLMRQLEEKDRQIAEKDMQIAQLIEQARNYQFLLKTEQERTLMLPQIESEKSDEKPKKRGIFSFLKL